MYCLHRKEKFDQFFKEKNFSQRIINNILKYVNINKLDYIENAKLNYEKNEHYMLIMRRFTDNEKLKKIFPDNYNYIIMSDRPRNWTHQIYFKGVFMNVSVRDIDYNRFNKKLKDIKVLYNDKPLIIIKDCTNVNISKLDIQDFVCITILRSNLNNIEPRRYKQIILRLEPYVTRYLYGKIFDKKLSKAFEQFIDSEIMKGINDFLIIDNINIYANFSKLYYLK